MELVLILIFVTAFFLFPAFIVATGCMRASQISQLLKEDGEESLVYRAPLPATREFKRDAAPTTN